jgi:hypothetical protein
MGADIWNSSPGNREKGGHPSPANLVRLFKFEDSDYFLSPMLDDYDLRIRAMPRDFFDPTPEQQNVVLVDAATLRKAEKLIESCEHCNAEGAEIPFNVILDRITGADPSVTDYILEQPAKCPNCHREILEKTLVEPA